MKNKIIPVLILVTIMLSFLSITGCRKGDQPDPPPINPTPELPLVKRIDKDEYTRVDLEYQNRRLSKLTQKDYLGSMDYAFMYNETGKPTAAILWGSIWYKFLYNGGLLTRIEYGEVSRPGVVDGYETFAYEGNRLTVQANFYTNGSSYLENAKTVYTYYANGDVRTITDSTLSSLPFRFVQEKRTEYEYDNQPASLRANTELFYLLHLNPTPHNAIKETLYDETSQWSETKTYQYQYNSDKLPVKATETTVAPGRPTATRNFTYTY